MAANRSTPAGLAAVVWGSSQAHSRSWGAREVRRVARNLFSEDAPGQGREWKFTPEQEAAIRREVVGRRPPD